MTRTARQLAATAIVIGGLAGCGTQSDSGGTTRNAGSSGPTPRRDQPAGAQHALKPVSPGAPGSAQAVLYRFATLTLAYSVANWYSTACARPGAPGETGLSSCWAPAG